MFLILLASKGLLVNKLSSRSSLSLKWLALGALCLCLVILAGCTSNPTIGQKSDSALLFDMTNGTGQDISAIAIGSAWSKDFSSDLDQSEPLADGKKATLYFTADSYAIPSNPDEKPLGADGKELDIALQPLANIQIKTADGMTYVMHQINLEDIQDATVKLSDGVAYLSYTSKESKQTVETLESEKAYADALKTQKEAEEKAAKEAKEAEEKAKAEAEAKEKAEKEAAEKAAKEQAEAEAAAQAAAEQAAAEQAQQQAQQAAAQPAAPAPQSTPAPAPAQPQANANAGASEDACVDDLILR